jgi:succinate dehydrogenase hydrophobic anchor subunit
VFAGLILIFLLGLHMFGFHFDTLLKLVEGDYLSWASVAERAEAVSQAVFYILFLGFALYHGFYGLRNILLELNLSEGTVGLVNKLLVVVGVLLFVFGTWAAIAAYRLANTQEPVMRLIGG